MAVNQLRVGISPCPNDVYIFSGLLLGAVQPGEAELCFEMNDVETLNRQAQAGELDIAKISAAAYRGVETDYVRLSCGGALGRGVGPLLLTGGASWNATRPTMLPGAHTTARLLFDFYAGPGAPRDYVQFDELYRKLLANRSAQGVVIHENRFTYLADGLKLERDLGAYWEQQTGAPIPLGMAVVRRRLGLKTSVEEWVRRSLRWATEHESEALALCAQHSQEMAPEIMLAHIRLYVNEYTMDTGPEGEAAIQRLMTIQP